MSVKVLIITAVAAEADAVAAGLDGVQPHPQGSANVRHTAAADILVAGVGSAVAAAATAAALARRRYSLVICAGIAGGIGIAGIGDIVVADAVHPADLGAMSPDGFIPLEHLGIAMTANAIDPPVVEELTGPLRYAGLAPVIGGILTVNTVTGTDAHADDLRRRYPGAVAEAMEGYGVAVAATRAGVRYGELRVVSNRVGRRDRRAWDIPGALRRLEHAFAALGAAWCNDGSGQAAAREIDGGCR